MMQSIILWIAASIITFLAGYTQSITSPDYPVNGTLNLASGYASFIFDKIYRGKGPYPVWIVCDFSRKDGSPNKLIGELEWRNKAGSGDWQKINMEQKGEALYAEIPPHPPLSLVEYRAVLNDNGKNYSVPEVSTVTLQFLGKVPPQIMQFFYITLFGGLLLGIRTGLEIFREHPRIKMYTIFTLISFFSFTLIFSTVKKGCELGIIGGSKVAQVSELFTSGPVILFVIWIAAMTLIFNTKKPKTWAIAASLATLLAFLLGRF